MALRGLLAATAPRVLEVERKFRSLAVRELTRTAGVPPFRSLRALPATTIRDAYFDRADALCSAGAWVRRRDGRWEAKIRRGGDFANSRFEEVRGARDVALCVRRILGAAHGGGGTSAFSYAGADALSDADAAADADNNFGLLPMAEFVTHRSAWFADGEFRIVLDRMDFGHEVGEVELEHQLGGGAAEADLLHAQGAGEDLGRQQRMLDGMDARIVEFMERYSWAFTPGEPVGKLTAYFEWMAKK
ncbi:Thiamine-triphosphatase [Escovopsis weberi]|uniref:Thiamine-triphosphatase n=1 Tax=Escovopsis weberi TaxID=150374 RepID=A0A0M9VV38_ESCWE|nr:Thiamine-triphosphatase [Escovopsis weberi]